MACCRVRQAERAGCNGGELGGRPTKSQRGGVTAVTDRAEGAGSPVDGRGGVGDMDGDGQITVLDIDHALRSTGHLQAVAGEADGEASMRA